MTTEIEQEFFRVFGIEPFCDLPCNKRGVECTDNTYCGNKYLEITAEKLLEMICIYSKYTIFCLPINAGDFEEKWTYEKLKNYILKELIGLYKANIYNTNQKLQSEIEQLFNET